MENLENFGVNELNSKEINEVNGGGIFAVLLIVAIGAILNEIFK